MILAVRGGDYALSACSQCCGLARRCTFVGVLGAKCYRSHSTKSSGNMADICGQLQREECGRKLFEF